MSLVLPAYIQRDPDYYVTDFSEYMTGAQPHDWSKRWGAAHYTPTVETSSGSLSGKALRFNITVTGGLGFFSWDRVSPAADVEILARGRVITNPLNTINTFTRLGARGAGGVGSEMAYSALAFYHTSAGTDWRIQTNKNVSGTSSIISGPTDGPSPTISSTGPSVWIWTRFRIQGSSISRKSWQHGASEPAFQDTISDASITAAGWVGDYVAEQQIHMRETDFFSVALRGKTASSSKR